MPPDSNTYPIDKKSTHLSYRPDIDGLRAIAIITVVLFHSFPKIMSGGYVGVDVFFVISGFLISGIILKGLQAGNFSFRYFYNNRIKRILPALIVVVAATYVFGYFTLLPDEFSQLGKQTAASIGFIQNFILWKESGYFDTAAALKPLLHLWSLSIEEQFYLIYPVCIWAAWRCGLNVGTAVVLLAFVSFGFNIGGIDKHAVRTFFLPHPRFWELLVGGLLAYQQLFMRPRLGAWLKRGIFDPLIFQRPSQPGRRDAVLNNLLSAFGLILIVAVACSLKEGAPYPGWRALLPVLGGSMVISAGPDAWCNRTILADRRMVFIGIISYPLYLWHWPLLSFVHIIGGAAPSVAVRFTAVASSVVLAWLTYRLVERPIRFGRKTWVKTAALCGLAVILGVTGYVTYARHGLTWRTVAKLNPALSTGAVDNQTDYIVPGCGDDGATNPDGFLWCQKDNRGTAKFALFGDSKAAALSKGLFLESNDNGRWLFIGHPSFVPVVSDAGIFASSQFLAKKGLDAITHNDNVKVVVLTVATRALFMLKTDFTIEDLPKNPNLEVAFGGLDKTVATLVAAGKKVVITVDNPTLIDPRFCVSRITAIEEVNLIAGLNKQRSGCSIGYDRQLELSQQYRTLLTRLSQKYPDQLRVFDPLDLLCDMKIRQCSFSIEGKVLYSYRDHISDYAAAMIAKKLVPFVEHFAAGP